MSFLYPIFLFAFLAVIIPIIIHLFDFQKPKKILFTNVRLLQQLQQSTNKGFKVKHLLVLFSRILFISFLVLAFTQPFIPSQSNSKIKGKQAVSLYVDNSLSMEQMKAGQKSLDLALQEALEIEKVFPINTSFQYLDNNFEAKDQYLIHKDQIKDRFTETRFSPISRELGAVVKRQKNALQTLGGSVQKNIFLLSDFQKTTTGNLTQLQADSNTIINLVPIQNETAENVFIDSLWLQNPFIKPKELNHLMVKLKNTGTQNSKKVALKLMIDGIQVSSNSVALEPASVKEIDFSFIINEIGFKQCSITFDDSPVTFDNVYYFTLQAARPINVLTIGEGKDNYLSKVYSSESFFALESNVNNGLNYNALNKSNLIALQEFDNLDESVLAQIKQKVLAGAAVVLFPSSHVSAEKANQLLRIFNIATTSLPVQNELQKVENPDIHHPFYYNIFEKFTGKENMPSAKPLYQIKAKALLKFKTGQTFLSESDLGKGKVYVCASSLQPESSTLASHAFFVPIMYKIAILSAKDQSNLAYSFNEKNISLTLSTEHQEIPVKLIKDDLEIVPAYQWTDGKLNLQLPKVEMTPGFYQLKQGDKLLSILAFNYGKQESTLEYYTAEQLKKIFSNQKNIKVFNVQDGGEASEAIKVEALGFNLWKYCLIMSLLFLLIEILLIRWQDLLNHKIFNFRK